MTRHVAHVSATELTQCMPRFKLGRWLCDVLPANPSKFH